MRNKTLWGELRISTNSSFYTFSHFHHFHSFILRGDGRLSQWKKTLRKHGARRSMASNLSFPGAPFLCLQPWDTNTHSPIFPTLGRRWMCVIFQHFPSWEVAKRRQLLAGSNDPACGYANRNFFSAMLDDDDIYELFWWNPLFWEEASSHTQGI